jgi:outer membrane protein OmpA-like peptidoglycan-associated protein
MLTNKKSTKSHFKKSILSIVIISAITGGLVLTVDQDKTDATLELSEQLKSFKTPVRTYNEAIVQTNYLKKSQDDSLSVKEAVESPLAEDSNSPMGDDLVKSGQVKTQQFNVAIGDKKTSVDILFDLSSSVIAEQYKLALVKMASDIKKQDPDKQWQVVGHTDKSGRVSYNLQLAHKRAENVLQFLVDQGVDKNRLKVITLGEYEASHLDDSTYNKGLRKVQVSEYRPEVSILAAKVQQGYEQIEKQRIKKEQLAATINVDNKLINKIEVSKEVDQETQMTSGNNKVEKTELLIESPTGANLPYQQSLNSSVTDVPLANNGKIGYDMLETLFTYHF